jgi:hypothetical protein
MTSFEWGRNTVVYSKEVILLIRPLLLSDHISDIVKYYCIPPPLKRGVGEEYSSILLYLKYGLIRVVAL